MNLTFFNNKSSAEQGIWKKQGTNLVTNEESSAPFILTKNLLKTQSKTHIA